MKFIPCSNSRFTFSSKHGQYTEPSCLFESSQTIASKYRIYFLKL